MLDVLMYLVEHYMESDSDAENIPDESSLRARLIDAGFLGQDIDKAFSWLDRLSEQPQLDKRLCRSQPDALRIYTEQETRILPEDCRGFMLFLEQSGIIDAGMRETIIDSAIALDSGELDLDKFKWILLMIMFNQPGQETSYTWLEDLVFDHQHAVLH